MAGEEDLGRTHIEGALVELLTIKSASTGGVRIPGLKFKIGDDYLSYNDTKKPNADGKLYKLKDGDLDHVSIESNGKTRYFSKIRSDAIDTLNSSNPKINTTGFKAIAWVETDANQMPLTQNAKKQVYVCCPGYDGNPSEGNFIPGTPALEKNRSPQTKSMYAVGKGELYPPMKLMPDFIKEVIAKTGADVEMHTVSHSMGSGNAIAATIACAEQGVAVKSCLHLDPIAASLAERKAKEAFPHLAEDRINTIIADHAQRAVSVVMVHYNEKGEVSFTRTGNLSTYKPKNGEDRTKAIAENEQFNINKILGVTPIPTPQTEASKDTDNRAPQGTVLYVDMTGREGISTSPTRLFDPHHIAANIAHSAADLENPPLTARSLEELTEKRNAAKAPNLKQQEKVPEKDKPVPPPGLPESLQSAILRDGATLMAANGTTIQTPQTSQAQSLVGLGGAGERSIG